MTDSLSLSCAAHTADEHSLRVLFGTLGRIESLLFSPPGEASLLPGGAASIVYASPEEASAALRLNGCLGWGAVL